MKHKDSILAIRKRIPIGLAAAKKLLEQTGHDVQIAVSIWKTEQVNLLAEKIAVKAEEAEELLQYVEYDFAGALSLLFY